MSKITSWMSWEGGVDLCAATQDGLAMPNVIIHVARMVHTPVGSAPAGMILYQPDPAAPPLVTGFCSPDAAVGAYFGPHIFTGTPFQTAPVLPAQIDISIDYPAHRSVTVAVTAGGHVFEVKMTNLQDLERINRAAGSMTPFTQDVVEAVALEVSLTVDGELAIINIPPVGISGGPAAVYAATGVYAR